MTTTAPRFEHNIFHSNMKDNVYGQVYSNLQILQVATNIVMHQGVLLIQLHECRLQPTTGLKNAIQINSGSALKGKDIQKFQKFQKNICEIVPFSLMLQPCCPEFLT